MAVVDATQERHRRGGLWLGWWTLWCFSHGLQPFDVPPLIATTARTRIHQKKWMPKITSLRLQCLSCDDGWCLHHGALAEWIGVTWRSLVHWNIKNLCFEVIASHKDFPCAKASRTLGFFWFLELHSFWGLGRRLLCETATEDVEVAGWVWAKERGYHHHVLA
jgi:hypothetical protein